MNFPVFDLHCDTASALLSHNDHQQKSLRSNSLHIDLERAKKLNAYAQCFACFTTTLKELPQGVSVQDVFERQLEVITQEINRNQDLIRQAYTPEDIESNKENGLMSAVLSIEGPAGFHFDYGLLENLYQIGFRISTLGWNESNPLTGSHITGEGLSEQGRAYVQEAQRLGMLVDVSHISDRAFWDIMDITHAPIIASHSNSRSICAVSRNLTDDMYLAICQTGGVVGLNAYANFLGEMPTLDTMCDHICHFLELDPSGTHIALGGDLDGCDVLAEDFCDVQGYLKLAQKLQERGLDDKMIYNIYWNNAIGVMKHCCM